MTKRIIAAIFLLGAFATAAGAQISIQPFTISGGGVGAICLQVPLPVFTYKKPDGTSTTGTTNIVLYKGHVSNYAVSTSYAQLFNLVGSPTASATPIASWAMAGASDKDITLGEVMGMPFNTGLEICCSTVQGTYTASAAGACGFTVEYR